MWNEDLAGHSDEAVLELPQLPARMRGDLSAKGIIGDDLLS
jgi:hypothetical protein